MAPRPLTEFSDFHQSVQSGNNRESKTNIEKNMPRVMTSLLMSSHLCQSALHQLFQHRYSNSRDIDVALLPPALLAELPGELAYRLYKVGMGLGGGGGGGGSYAF